MFIANRTQKRQEKKIVEESGQPLLTLRSQGCVLVVSGDANSVRQIKEAKPILDYLEQIPLINPAPEEGRSMSAMRKTTKNSLFLNCSVRSETKKRDGNSNLQEKVKVLCDFLFYDYGPIQITPSIDPVLDIQTGF